MADSEPLSKNELKRRQKAEKKAAEKKEKEAKKAEEAAAKGEPKKVEKASEEDISPNEYFKLRSAAVEELKNGSNHPYPHKFHVNTSLTEFIEKYTSLEAGETKDQGKIPYINNENGVAISSRIRLINFWNQAINDYNSL